jgi:O-antigen ligase
MLAAVISRGRVSVAPAYLFACLLIGGSAQGIWQNMLLQIVGVIIIGWAAIDKGEEHVTGAARQLLILALLAVSVVAIQTVPLPPTIWTRLGPRREIADGFHALGLAVPPEPLSLAPAASLNSLLGFIPPLAIFCSMVRLSAYRPKWLAIALVAGTVFGIALGALQVASSSAAGSSWYLYEDTSTGRGVGFFANADHMATLLVVTIPFLAAITASAKTANMQRYSAVVVVAGGLGLLVAIGIALNGSLAGYGLAIPVIASSSLVLLAAGNRVRLWIAVLAAVLAIGAAVTLETTAIGSRQIGEHAASAVESRSELLATSSRAAADFFPFGSGLGSFPRVYSLYENPREVTDTYVVHAHNDFVELTVELGLAGIALMLAFFTWWLFAVWRAWRTSEAGPYARAATIASAAILFHTAVDFPLRTAAIAACFAMCLALLADSRAAPPKENAQIRRSRHVIIR